MKKIYLLALSVTSGFAQPVITASQLPATLQTEAMVAQTSGLHPGTPGADKIWDFSALELMSVGSLDVVAPSQTPAAAMFSSATHCMAYLGSFDESFQYLRSSNGQLELIGEVYPGIIALNYLQNPKTVVAFPYTFNTVISDTYQSNFDDHPIAFTATYDAYGTLIMPFGSYQAIRQTIIQDGQTDYIWYNADPFFPIIQTAMANGSMGIMKNTDILTRTTFGDNLQPALWPNPTRDQFELRLFGTADATVDVFDLAGKCVLRQRATGTRPIISLAHCDAGMYLVRVSCNEESRTLKVVKQ